MSFGENVQSILILVVGGIQLISSTITPMQKCELPHPTARYFRGHCFIVGDDRATWNVANDKCKIFRNGHLAIASSSILADFIARNILTPHSYNDSWVGLKQSEDPLSQWIWYYKTHDYLSRPISISINNFTATSNNKCVTIGKNSPRLKNEDCNIEKNFVCQYAFGGQLFREVKKLTNKKPLSSSAALSFLANVEPQCTAVCGTSPALSLAYNQDTHHCEIYLELTGELELSDSPGYVMLEKEGLGNVLGCVVAEADLLLENATAQLEGSADFAKIDRHDMTCIAGFYLTEQNPSNNKWYTTTTPPKFVCKDDGTWEMGNTGGKTFKCLKIPATHPIYEYLEPLDLNDHYFSATPGGLLKFYAISPTAYCPEKAPLYLVYSKQGTSVDHFYTTNYNSVEWLVSHGYSNIGIFTYVVVGAKCGATKRINGFSKKIGSRYNHYYHTQKTVAGWSYNGYAWHAW